MDRRQLVLTAGAAVNGGLTFNSTAKTATLTSLGLGSSSTPSFTSINLPGALGTTTAMQIGGSTLYGPSAGVLQTPGVMRANTVSVLDTLAFTSTSLKEITPGVLKLTGSLTLTSPLGTSSGGLGLDASTVPANNLLYTSGAGFFSSAPLTTFSRGLLALTDQASWASAMLPSSGVSAGNYGTSTQIPQISVDAKGRITAATSVSIGSTTPSGAAGGDLVGTYPNPTLANSSVTAGVYGSASQIPVFSVDAKGRVTGVTNTAITATGATGAAGGDLAGTFPTPSLTLTGVIPAIYGSATQIPQLTVDAKGRITNVATLTLQTTGAAGGDLAGTYPNPSLAASGVTAGSYGSTTAIPQITVDAKGRITAITPLLLTTTGAAGGDLTGNYPNPTLAVTGAIAGTYGSSTAVPRITVDTKGRITAVTSTPVSIDIPATGVTPGIYGGATQVPVFAVDASGRISSVTNTDVSAASGATGPAGGDLNGSYPNPLLDSVNSNVGTYGGYASTVVTVPVITVDAKGRVTSVSTQASAAIPTGLGTANSPTFAGLTLNGNFTMNSGNATFAGNLSGVSTLSATNANITQLLTSGSSKTGAFATGTNIGSPFGSNWNESSTYFEADGTMVMVGSATAWERIDLPIASGLVYTTTSPYNMSSPTVSSLTYSPDYETWSFPPRATNTSGVTTVVCFTIQVPYSAKAGSRMYPRILWQQANSNAGNTLWRVYFNSCGVGTQNPTSGFNTMSVEQRRGDIVSPSYPFLQESTSASDYITVNPGDLLRVRLSREYQSGDVAVPIFSFSLFFERDTLGARSSTSGTITK